MSQKYAQVQAIKAAVRKRDGYKCVDCGMTQAEYRERWNERHRRPGETSRLIVLDVHRIVADGVYSLENCQTLCRKCHCRHRRDYAAPPEFRKLVAWALKIENEKKWALGAEKRKAFYERKSQRWEEYFGPGGAKMFLDMVASPRKKCSNVSKATGHNRYNSSHG